MEDFSVLHFLYLYTDTAANILTLGNKNMKLFKSVSIFACG